MTAPGIVIAAPESGVGKTTFTAGLCRALARRGVRVQPFKAGPDFIDPSYHTLAAGRECRNLDGFLTSPSTLPFLYARGCAGADVAVVEGVMGLYDGIGHRGRNSTASLARTLSLRWCSFWTPRKARRASPRRPWVFATLSTTEEGRRVPPPSVVGVILCGLREGELKTLISEAVERFAGLPVLGSIRQVPEAHFPSRHLGLIPAAERSELSLQLERLADAIDEGVSLERLTALAKAPSIPAGASFPPEVSRVLEAAPRQGARIAVARDKVFTFYYRDGLDLLEELGAELLETSPAADAALPEEIDGLYLGGGYPEEFLGELSGNESYLADLRRWRVLGLPVYAECGGMMYLARRSRTERRAGRSRGPSRSLRDHDGTTAPFRLCGGTPGGGDAARLPGRDASGARVPLYRERRRAPDGLSGPKGVPSGGLLERGVCAAEPARLLRAPAFLGLSRRGGPFCRHLPELEECPCSLSRFVWR
jgi:cobyrinic acid a,c-diamide synthase